MALFQGRGPFATKIPFVRDQYQASFFVTDAEDDSLATVFADEMIDAITSINPAFFANFEAHMLSGDHFVIQDGLSAAASITLAAAMTMPGFQQQLQAAAENEQLLSSAVAEIHQEDPESEMDVEDLQALLITLGDGQEPLCCSAAIYCYLAIEIAHWVTTAMNIFEFVNAAVWFNAFLWQNTWIFNKKKVPTEEVNFGGGTLTAEMMVDYIAQKWGQPIPVEM